MLFEELSNHDVSGDEGWRVRFLAQGLPVHHCEPRMLLDLPYGLGPLTRVFIKQTLYQVAKEYFSRSIARNPDESVIWLAF
mgnify:CR=1 FL=1